MLDAINSDTLSTHEVLSTRQVAQLLGVGEATVKRWADSGEIDCVRSPGGHRKFRLRDVTSFVQKRRQEVVGAQPSPLSPDGASVADAIAALEKHALRGDISACIAQMATLRLTGTSLAEIFDERLSPALRSIGRKREKGTLSAPEELVAIETVLAAVARAQPLAEPPGEPNRADRGTAVVASFDAGSQEVATRMAACLLRARCFEVLVPPRQTTPRDLAEMIVRARAAIVALACSARHDPPALVEQIEVAAQAARQTGGVLLVIGPGTSSLRLPQGARLLTSMQQLVAESAPAGRRRA